jgi:hypothetical protein
MNDDMLRQEQGVTRRDALKKGAMLGTAAFVIPAVATFSMDKAFAQSASGGGRDSGTSGGHHEGDGGSGDQGENNNDQ